MINKFCFVQKKVVPLQFSTTEKCSFKVRFTTYLVINIPKLFNA